MKGFRTKYKIAIIKIEQKITNKNMFLVEKPPLIFFVVIVATKIQI